MPRYTVLLALGVVLAVALIACHSGPGDSPTGQQDLDSQPPPPPPPPSAMIVPEYRGPMPTSMDAFPTVSTKDLQKMKKALAKAIKKGTKFAPLHPEFEALWERVETNADSVVAEIGAGNGLFTLVGLERNAPFHTYYAAESDLHSVSFLNYLFTDLKAQGARTVKAVLSETTDFPLPPNSVDVVIIHHQPHLTGYSVADGQIGVVESTIKTVASITSAMKDGAVLHMIVDPKLRHQLKSLAKQDPPFEEAAYAFTRAGFTLEKTELLEVGGEKLMYVMLRNSAATEKKPAE
ncbi:MAG: class I SAM-dependent methyltransferase [Candidatus Lernaella stagnicola]|nr:class I SAM-dependent methyltransferase [Candidatus Lernaella stagnicola]